MFDAQIAVALFLAFLLGMVAGSDHHVVPSLHQSPPDRGEQQGMWRIGEVDPDLHAQGVNPWLRREGAPPPQPRRR